MTSSAAPALRLLCLLVATALASSLVVVESAAASVDHQAWVDAVRADVGLPPLVRASDLDRVAAAQSERMAEQARLHHTPDLGAAVTGWEAVAENVGVGVDLGQVLDGLLDSEGHRANLLATDLTEVGFAVVERDGRVWVTQVFRRPSRPSADRGATLDATRLAGHDRWATAVAVSRRQFPSGADVVFLASADRLADAVAGGTLTAGPLLLVPSCGPLPPDVAAEIARVDPTRVVALGGPLAVCDALLGAASDGRVATRLAGGDRHATSVAVARWQFPDGARTAYLARGDEFADAVAGGSLTDGPVLLVPSCGEVPPVVAFELARLGADEVVALGGEQAVCEATLVAAAAGRASSRLAGGDRYATAAAIAVRAFPAGSAAVHLAGGDRYADAVVGGVLTAGPVLLVPSCGGLPAVVSAVVTRLGAPDVLVLGDTTAVCDDLVARVAAVR